MAIIAPIPLTKNNLPFKISLLAITLATASATFAQTNLGTVTNEDLTFDGDKPTLKINSPSVAESINVVDLETPITGSNFTIAITNSLTVNGDTHVSIDSDNSLGAGDGATHAFYLEGKDAEAHLNGNVEIVNTHADGIQSVFGAKGVCNFSCPGQIYRWGGAIRPSSFLRLGNPQSGQKGRSLSAIARVVKHSWNCTRPKASADRPEQMPRKVLAQPERLPIACGLGDAKRSACSPPSHAAASAGVTGAEPLSRGWQSVQAFHLG